MLLVRKRLMAYLSFVVSANNISYEGDFISRLQRELDTIYTLAPRYGLNAEFVIVDWNTPKENKSVKDSLNWSKASIPTRVVIVPPEIHDSLPNPYGLNFFECIAKNVGVKRSRGEFIATINADSLYSPEMVARLAEHNLDKDCFYRADRWDITPEGRVIQVNRWEGSFAPDGRPPLTPPMAEYDFGPSPKLHFNASGEFTLMAARKWHEIGAHPEVPFNCHVDGYMVYLAAKAGLKQVILPQPIFHQEHPRHTDDKYRGYKPFWDDEKPYSPPTNPEWGLANHKLETITIL